MESAATTTATKQERDQDDAADNVKLIDQIHFGSG